MTQFWDVCPPDFHISTHMPLARHDASIFGTMPHVDTISTHMPLARHDKSNPAVDTSILISTHMPLARHDRYILHSNRIFTPHIETDYYFFTILYHFPMKNDSFLRRTFLIFLQHLTFAFSYNNYAFGIVCFLCPNMLHSSLPIISQIVKS